jgi:hypothetical protein
MKCAIKALIGVAKRPKRDAGLGQQFDLPTNGRKIQAVKNLLNHTFGC